VHPKKPTTQEMSKIVQDSNASIHNQVQNGLRQYRRLSSGGKISISSVPINSRLQNQIALNS